MTLVARMIDDVLRREGGLVSHVADRGGVTHYGITRPTLGRWRDRPVTDEDVRDLSADEARQIYERWYYEQPGIRRLPELVQPVVFDAAVNQGPGTAVQLLQRALNRERLDLNPLIARAGLETIEMLAVDGVIGPKTVAAAELVVEFVGQWLVVAVIEERRRHYIALAVADPSQEAFLDGWMNRLADLIP